MNIQVPETQIINTDFWALAISIVFMTHNHSSIEIENLPQSS